MTDVDEETVSATQDLITQKLMETGQLGKMQAMVIEASLAALKEEDTGDSLFHSTPQLKQERKSESGLLALSVVSEYLKTLGLLHTANVLELEAGVEAKSLQTRDALAKKYGAPSGNTVPVLTKILEGGVPAGAAAAAPAAAAPAKETSPVKATSISKADVSSSVAAVLAKNAAQEAAAAKPPPGGNAKSKETPYYISNWEGRDFERRNAVKGQQVAIEDLKKCKVIVYDAVDSITMDACEDCELIVAACEGSIFIRECTNVKIVVACKQLRFRDSAYCPVYLFASTDPVVESSHHIDFYPFNAQLPNLIERFKEARLDPAMNRFVHVYDFTEDDTSIPQPHFSIKYPNHGCKMTQYGKEHGTPEAPKEIQLLLDGKMEPAPSSENKNKSYNIKTGGAAWNASSNAEPEPTAVTKPAAKPAATAAPAAAPKAASPVSQPPNTLSRDSDSESYSSFEEDDDEF